MKTTSIKDKIHFFFSFFKFAIFYIRMLFKWLITPQNKNKIARYEAANAMINTMQNEVEVVGTRDEETTLFLVNHTSMIDIVLLEAYFKDDVCWIGKKELNKLGVLGVLQYPKHIILDRSSKSSMITMIKQAKKNINLNRAIVIFPEGTRSKKDTLLPFKAGAKVLAQTLKAKVQPIVLSGLKESIDFKNKKFNKNIKITIEFLDSIQIDKDMKDNENWYEDIREKMQKVYQKNNAKININE